MRRVALFRARRSGDDSLVAVLVRELRDGLRLRLAAARAGEGFDAGLSLRRLLGHFAIVPCVAERVRVSIHIAITAGAGVRRVALFRARWSGHGRRVIMGVRGRKCHWLRPILFAIHNNIEARAVFFSGLKRNTKFAVNIIVEFQIRACNWIQLITRPNHFAAFIVDANTRLCENDFLRKCDPGNNVCASLCDVRRRGAFPSCCERCS